MDIINELTLPRINITNDMLINFSKHIPSIIENKNFSIFSVDNELIDINEGCLTRILNSASKQPHHRPFIKLLNGLGDEDHIFPKITYINDRGKDYNTVSSHLGSYYRTEIMIPNIDVMDYIIKTS